MARGSHTHRRCPDCDRVSHQPGIIAPVGRRPMYFTRYSGATPYGFGYSVNKRRAWEAVDALCRDPASREHVRVEVATNASRALVRGVDSDGALRVKTVPRGFRTRDDHKVHTVVYLPAAQARGGGMPGMHDAALCCRTHWRQWGSRKALCKVKGAQHRRDLEAVHDGSPTAQLFHEMVAWDDVDDERCADALDACWEDWARCTAPEHMWVNGAPLVHAEGEAWGEAYGEGGERERACEDDVYAPPAEFVLCREDFPPLGRTPPCSQAPEEEEGTEEAVPEEEEQAVPEECAVPEEAVPCSPGACSAGSAASLASLASLASAASSAGSWELVDGDMSDDEGFVLV